MINPKSLDLAAIAYGILIIAFLLLIIANRITFRRR